MLSVHIIFFFYISQKLKKNLENKSEKWKLCKKIGGIYL